MVILAKTLDIAESGDIQWAMGWLFFLMALRHGTAAGRPPLSVTMRPRNDCQT